MRKDRWTLYVSYRSEAGVRIRQFGVNSNILVIGESGSEVRIGSGSDNFGLFRTLGVIFSAINVGQRFGAGQNLLELSFLLHFDLVVLCGLGGVAVTFLAEKKTHTFQVVITFRG